MAPRWTDSTAALDWTTITVGLGLVTGPVRGLLPSHVALPAILQTSLRFACPADDVPVRVTLLPQFTILPVCYVPHRLLDICRTCRALTPSLWLYARHLVAATPAKCRCCWPRSVDTLDGLRRLYRRHSYTARYTVLTFSGFCVRLVVVLTATYIPALPVHAILTLFQPVATFPGPDLTTLVLTVWMDRNRRPPPLRRHAAAGWVCLAAVPSTDSWPLYRIAAAGGRVLPRFAPDS